MCKLKCHVCICSFVPSNVYNLPHDTPTVARPALCATRTKLISVGIKSSPSLACQLPQSLTCYPRQMGLSRDLLEQLAFYGSYHRNRWNQLIHFVFVPLIVWSAVVWACYTGPLLRVDLPALAAHVLPASIARCYLPPLLLSQLA